MDKALAVGDRETKTWNDLQLAVALNPDRRLPFRIVREGVEQTLEIAIGETEREAMGRVGVLPYYAKVKIAGVEPEGAAARAGLLEGDEIGSVAGLDVGSHIEQISKALSDVHGSPVAIVVRRGAEEISRSLVPAAGKDGRGDPGFALMPDSVLRKYGPLQAIVESVKLNAKSAGVLFITLKKLFTGP